jgi:hypothetical protein
VAACVPGSSEARELARFPVKDWTRGPPPPPPESLGRSLQLGCAWTCPSRTCPPHTRPRLERPLALWAYAYYVYVRTSYVSYEGLVKLRARFCGKKDALGQTAPQSGPKCEGGGGTTAHGARPHALDGAPTVGAARIGRGAVLEGCAAT